MRTLGQVLGDEIRLWRASGGELQLVAGSPPASDQSVPSIPKTTGLGGSALSALPGIPDYYYQCGDDHRDTALGLLLAQMVKSERDTLAAAGEVSRRYEEIDLLYTISDVLGRTIGLEEAANIIVQEVSKVVGARRASILVHDEELGTLRPVAGWGVDVSDFNPISVDDETAVSARAFRECATVLRNASDEALRKDPRAMTRPYRGRAFLSVPIVYPDPHGVARPVGVINLTDRLSEDEFSVGDAKLVTAIAHQIGAAIENARLVVRDRQQQRVRQALELAHDLQLRLLPSPAVLGTHVDVAAVCRSADSVGGDFYQFVRLPGSQVGVMLGDVSTHGLTAALIMALVLSASGIHAAEAASPEIALDRLLASVGSELAETDMYLSLFYGVADADHGTLRYANAGHPYAFRLPADGPPERLEANAPPLGLGDATSMTGSEVAWERDSDLLLLFSDGITETNSASGESFGEGRVIDIVRQCRHEPSRRIVEAVFDAVSSFSDVATDDRTVVVLKA